MDYLLLMLQESYIEILSLVTYFSASFLLFRSVPRSIRRLTRVNVAIWDGNPNLPILD